MKKTKSLKPLSSLRIKLLTGTLLVSCLLVLTEISAQEAREKKEDGSAILAQVNDHLDNPDKCLKLLQNASDIFYSEENWKLHAYSLCGIANCHYAFYGDYPTYGRYMDSLFQYSAYYSSSKDRYYFSIQNAAVLYYNRKGRIDKSIEILEEVAANQDSISRPELRTALMDKLAEAYTSNGDYAKAKEMHLVNLETKEIPHTRAKSFYFLSHLASIEGKLGEAISVISTAINILDSEKSTEIITRDKDIAVISKIEYLFQDGQISSCKKYIHKYAPQLLEAIPEVQTRYWKSKAEIALEESDFKSAKNYLNSATQIVRTKDLKDAKLSQQLIPLQLLENKILISSDKLEEAEQKLVTTLNDIGINPVSDPILLPEDQDELVAIKLLKALANTKTRLSTKSESSQNDDSILGIYASILTLSKRIRSNYTDRSHLEYWAEHNQYIYEKAVAVALTAKQDEVAFEFIEENKANLLISSINESTAKGYAKIPISLLEREEECKASIRQLRKEIQKQKASKKPNLEVATSLAKALNKKQVELSTLNKNLETNYPTYHKLKYQNNKISIADIQNLLQADALFLEYFVGTESIYLSMFKANKSRIIEIPKTDSLLTQISNFKKLSRSKGASSADLIECSKALCQALFMPAAEYLSSDIEQLILVLDDVLSNLPFELFINESDNYLLEDYNIQYQYSARLWKMATQKHQRIYDDELLTYEYNGQNNDYNNHRSCNGADFGKLLCSNKEIQSISTILDQNTKDKPVFDRSILDQSISSKIIHLATHSCHDTVEYNNSKIIFDDFSLSLQEIEAKNIQAELTVLSSCESGYGKVHKGEGAMSIAKAFFQAGSRSALVSLWPVDDCSTADIMKYFYQELRKGKTKDAALAAAKKNYLATAHPSRSHPYYWAGFVLIGNAEALWSAEFTSFSSTPILLVVAVLLIIALIVVMKKRQYFSHYLQSH